MKQKPTFKDALIFWLKLGFISFGGPAGQVAIMHEFLVERKKWVSESRFMHALNYCMVLPGPEAQQLATYIGWLLHGTWGGLCAGLLFVLPSMFMLLGLAVVYVSFGEVPLIQSMFVGLKPAVLAIVVLALFKIGKKSLLSPFHVAVSVLAFLIIFLFNIPFPLIILGTLALAFVGKRIFPVFFAAKPAQKSNIKSNEEDYFINSDSVHNNDVVFSMSRLIGQLATGLALWLFPFLLFYFLVDDFLFWQKLSLFFSQAAIVTFGGAYAVLPYVAQVAVEKFNWLSSLEMIDALALGESTPGPLIMVLVFVGFLAGYHHFSGSLAMGTLGLLATTFFTFLPSFLFIFVGAPLIEKTRENTQLKHVLSLVSAAVVGVMLNLTVYLGRAVFFPSGLAIDKLEVYSLLWSILSLVALQKFKVNLMLWILVSVVVFGVLKGIFGLV